MPTAVVPAPEDTSSGLRSWVAVLSIALGAFVVVTSEFLPIGLLTRIAGGLHVSDGTAGLMVTVPGLVAALAAPLLTIGLHRVDRGHCVLALIAALVASDMIAALAPNFTIMLLGRILFGISLGGFWTIAVTLGPRLVRSAYVTQATTLITSGISIATVLGVPAGSFIAEFGGWRLAFGAIGGMALLTGVVQFFVMPPIPPPPSPGFRQLTNLLHHADARLGLMTIAVVIAGHFAGYTYVAPFIKENTTLSTSALSSLLLAYGVAGVAGNFAGGAGVAKNLRRTVTITVAALAASMLLMPLASGHTAGVTALLILWGLAFGAMPISLQLWVFKAAPEALEGGAALMVSTFQIFIALGSMLGGQVVDHFGTSSVMIGAGLCTAVGLILINLSKHQATPYRSSKST